MIAPTKTKTSLLGGQGQEDKILGPEKHPRVGHTISKISAIRVGSLTWENTLWNQPRS